MTEKPVPAQQQGDGENPPQQPGGIQQGTQQQQGSGSTSSQTGQTIFRDWASI